MARLRSRLSHTGIIAFFACSMVSLALFSGSPRATAAVLPAPSSDTSIYTLEPLDYNLFPVMKTLLRGACLKAGPNCTKIWTPAALDPSHLRGVIGEVGPISIGAFALDAAFRSDGDKNVVVLGYSQGGQVAAFWLRNLSQNASSYAPPSTTSFLLVGNPENTYSPPWLPKTPTDTGYQVTELWRQYDGWADWPTHFNLIAYANAIAGMLYVHPFAYVDADPDDPNNVRWTDGNTTYVMIPSHDLPLLQPLRFIGLGFVADALNDPLKKIVDSAYDHPQSASDVAAQTPSATAADAADSGAATAAARTTTGLSRAAATSEPRATAPESAATTESAVTTESSSTPESSDSSGTSEAATESSVVESPPASPVPTEPTVPTEPIGQSSPTVPNGTEGSAGSEGGTTEGGATTGAPSEAPARAADASATGGE